MLQSLTVARANRDSKRNLCKFSAGGLGLDLGLNSRNFSRRGHLGSFIPFLLDLAKLNRSAKLSRGF